MAIRPVYDGLTALAGGGQGGTPLREGINRVTTVATAADSMNLPSTQNTTGEDLVVINAAAANSMTVYPATGEKINALSANAGLAIAANKTAVFYITGPGQWHSLLTA
jgi:hypothetical protein